VLVVIIGKEFITNQALALTSHAQAAIHFDVWKPFDKRGVHASAVGG